MANKFQFHYANSLLSSAHESDEANVEACEDIIVGEHEFGEELQQQFNSLPTQLLCVADKLNFRHTSYRLLDVLGFSKSDDSYEFYFVDAQPIPIDNNNNLAHFQPLQPNELGSLPKNTVKSLPINTFWSLPMIAL
uniref:Uncharacterized protein n=1 Tax=Plectus sambesii TaxID=2011161 RepID=A0A914V788_9BILA